MFAGNTTVVATPNQVSSALGEETIILDAQAGQYYGLNAVGTTIWNLVQSPHTVEQIEAALLATYEVDAAACRDDLQGILQQLASQGLIQVCDAVVA